jgi:MtaA/CmuA family methyltransferase
VNSILSCYGTRMQVMEWLSRLGRRAVIPVGGLLGTALTGTTVRGNMLDPAVKAESAACLHLELGTDAVFHIGDVAVEAEAIGAPVALPENDPPEIQASILKDPDGLRLLADADIHASPRAAVTLECVRILAQRFPRSIVLGQVTGPLTIAGGLLGYERMLRLAITDRPFLEATLELCAQVAVQFARLQMEAGAGMLWVGEPMGALLSPRLFAELSGPRLSNVLAVSPDWNILHVCGDTTPHVEVLVATGARVLSLDAAVELPGVVQRVPEDVVVMGNIDPVRVLKQGLEEDVRRAAEELLEAMDPYDNFILSTGCSMPRTAPLANAHALVAVAKRWKRRPSE